MRKKDLDLYFDFEDQLPKQTSDQDLTDQQKQLLAALYKELEEATDVQVDVKWREELISKILKIEKGDN